MANYHQRNIRKALRKNRLADSFSFSLFQISPYMACAHGCAYCDGRAEKYYVEGDFDQDIIIRNNLPEQLNLELLKLREWGNICISSGITDCYQPAEKEFRLTRACAEIIAESGFPATVMTKSSLILRDLDLWSRVNDNSKFHLMVSLTTLDDRIRSIFEPGASPVDERLEIIRQFKDAGAAVGVLAMPFLPFLTDTDENLSSLIPALAELGVDYIMPGTLTLRPGRQKEFFFKRIEKEYPELLQSYESLYSGNLQSGNSPWDYRKRIFSLWNRILDRESMSSVLPHRIFRQMLPPHQSLRVLLQQMVELYSRKGIDVGELIKSLANYDLWLEEKIKYFNRRTSLPPDYLQTEFDLFVRDGEMKEVIQNRKLEVFISKVILEQKIFDPVQLKLIENTHDYSSNLRSTPS